MPTVSINKFRGINSDPMRILDPREAIVAEDVIINRGHICNVPHPRDTGFDGIGFEQLLYRQIEEYSKNGKHYIISASRLARPSTSGRIFITEDFQVIFKEDPQYNFKQVPIGQFFDDWWNKLNWHYERRELGRLGTLPTYEMERMNMVQFGNWIYCLGQFQIELRDSLPPVMGRIRHVGNSRKTETWLPQLVGIQPIDLVKYGGEISSGSVSFNGRWGFTLRVYWREEPEDTPVLFYESTITEEDDETGRTIINKKILFFIYPHQEFGSAFYPNLQDTRQVIKVGVYVAPATGDGTFRYAGYDVDITGEAPETDQTLQRQFFRFNIDTDPAEDGDPGPTVERRIPSPSYHAAMYKKRVYYLNIRSTKGTWTTGIDISVPIPGAGQGEAIEANYIQETRQLPQNDGGEFAGCIEYMGQLIIFRDNSTWVLTDDPINRGGEFRLLFPDIGCVSKNGGRAYIVIDEILYWVANDGIYGYNGQSAPIRISELIQEDLEKIPREEYFLCRIGVDRRYGLLYFSFKHKHIWIYHYKEREPEEGVGQWTKLTENITQVIPSQIGIQVREHTVFYASKIGIHRVAKLEDSTGETSLLFFPYWVSGRITIGDIHRLKHFKLLKIEGVFDSVQGLLLWGAGDPDIFPGSGRVYSVVNDRIQSLRSHREWVSLILKYTRSAVLRSFRLTQFRLEVSIDGKR